MKKPIVLLALIFGIQCAVVAQSKEERRYKERAVEVQDEIWGFKDPAFEVNEVPAKYKNESAVIIAKSYEVTNSAKTRYKFGLFGGSFTKRFRYYTTLREKVKINDKSALEEFSTLEYKKNLNNTSRLLLKKIVETYKTFVGARIIKPDGKKVIISADEEVLTKDESRDKEGKLAIPDLQIGDILDYYVRIEEVTENGADVRGPDYFLLGGEYPMMYYNVKYILDRRCGVDVISVNGAKRMDKTTNDDDDMIIQFTERDLPKFKQPMWSSAARQYPYHALRYVYVNSYSSHFSAGTVNRGPLASEYVKTLKNYLAYSVSNRNQDNNMKNALADYFGGKKKLRDVPIDSIVNYVYNYYKWAEYANMGSGGINADNDDFNYRGMSPLEKAYYISEVLFSLDIESEIVIVCSRYSNRLEDVVILGDVDCILQVHSGGKTLYLGFYDFFHLTGELPANFQGEDVITLNREGRKNRAEFDEDKGKLPVTTSKDNQLEENLTVQLNPSNLQQLTIDRTVRLTGAMKKGDQKNILLVEDVDKRFAGLVGKKSLYDIYNDDKRSKARAAEVATAFAKERLRQKDYVKNEIKSNYDQEPAELKSFAILKDGLSLQEPEFIYKSQFTMDNFVKKAGPKYILEVGKLMGIFSKLDSADRVRTMDIYMSAARTLTYNFTIAIPEGYKVKGIEELNKSVKNESGSFVSTAKVEGKNIVVTATREYLHNFEKAEKWPLLLNIMDAASVFTESKLLLEK